MPPTRWSGPRSSFSCGGAGTVPRRRCRPTQGAGGHRLASAPRRPHPKPRPPLPAQSGVSPDRGFLQGDPRLGSALHARTGFSLLGISREEHRERIPGGCRPLASHQRARGVEGGHPHPNPPRSCELKVNPAALRSRLSSRSALGAAAPLPPTAAGRAGQRSHSPTAACCSCSSRGKAEAGAAAPSRRH